MSLGIVLTGLTWSTWGSSPWCVDGGRLRCARRGTLAGVKIARASRWTDAVFHVLAHVPVDAPASVYDPVYIRFAGRKIDDAALLASLLPTHDALAEAQLLAWLWDTPERARSKDLSQLTADEVDAPGLLSHLHGPGVEILRANAELEIDRLPRFTIDEDALAAALGRVRAAAPSLEEVFVCPPLRMRGRVFDGRIYVGAPVELDVEHVAWQAAHEATVRDLGPGPYELVEPRAVMLLRERAREAGLGASHARWWSVYEASERSAT
jgi:hypothetical protein